MSDPLDRAVDARIDAFRPDRTPPFAMLLNRQRTQRRRRKILLAAAPVAAALLIAPVAWSAATSGGDRLTQQADSEPRDGQRAAFGVHPVLDVARFNYSTASESPSELPPVTFPAWPVGGDCYAAAEGLPPEASGQPADAFVACAYNSPISSEVYRPSEVYRLGPAALTGDDVSEASAFETLEGTDDWAVSVILTEDGKAAFTSLTGQAACAQMGSPQRRLAFVVDGEVVNGETTVAPDVACGVGITSGRAAITGGGFGEAEAQDLARRITAASDTADEGVAVSEPTRYPITPEATDNMTAADYVGVWTGPDGEPAEQGEGQERTFELASRRMPDHCDWEKAVVLQVPWPLGTTTYFIGPNEAPLRQYTRDADGVLARFPDAFRGELELDAILPEGSRPTGYRLGEVELWFGPDQGEDYAYLVNPDGVERWPVEVESILCG